MFPIHSLLDLAGAAAIQIGKGFFVLGRYAHHGLVAEWTADHDITSPLGCVSPELL